MSHNVSDGDDFYLGGDAPSREMWREGNGGHFCRPCLSLPYRLFDVIHERQHLGVRATDAQRGQFRESILLHLPGGATTSGYVAKRLGCMGLAERAGDW